VPKIRDVIALMNKLAPEDTASAWDNSGLIIGDENTEISNCIIALDCTDDTIKQASERNAGLIITHHPIIFGSLRRINASDGFGRRLMKLIQNGCAVYSAHTNLDMAENGTNDALFELLRLNGKERLIVENEHIGRVGFTGQPYGLKAFAKLAASLLNTGGISYAGRDDSPVRKIGLCAGSASGKKYMDAAKAQGCDVYLTGDISYHAAQYAADIGLNLISAPHFAAEVLITDILREYLTAEALTAGLDINFFTQENQQDIFKYL